MCCARKNEPSTPIQADLGPNLQNPDATAGVVRLPTRLPVSIVRDRVEDGFARIRDTTSPVDVAVVHDGSDTAAVDAENYEQLLSLAPVMLTVLSEAASVWQEQFDGPPDTDLNVSGSDVIVSLSDWRLRARNALPRLRTGHDAVMDREEPPTTLFWVAAYLADRAYGGGEEGGWFFDCGSLVTDLAIYRQLGAAPAAFVTAPRPTSMPHKWNATST